MSEKIGVGIVTCGRKDNFEKLFESLLSCKEQINHLCIVEDSIGDNPDFNNYINDVTGGLWKNDTTLRKVTTDENLGVAKAKNNAFYWLTQNKCDHIFLIEDDIFIKDVTVFDKYIEASKRTGIQHFNFSQHGMMNKAWPGGTPNPRTVLDYGDLKVPLYPHCVGAFSYYSRKCLETVGFMDEKYYNACEHVDHTLEIIKAGMHPPFWYFADIENSWEFLGDDEWSIQQSTISSKSNHKEIVAKADEIFWKKHGCLPGQIPLTIEPIMVKTIKEIKKNYGN